MTELAQFFDTQFSNRPNHFPHWFTEHQNNAYQHYQKLGLPSRKTESWKYTSVAQLQQQALHSSQITIKYVEQPSHLIKITDGVIALPKQLPKGLQILPLSEALNLYQTQLEPIFENQDLHHNHCFDYLNLACLQEGLFFLFETNSVFEQPIEVHISSSQSNIANQYRHVFLAETGAAVDIIEKFSGEADTQYLLNHTSQLVAEPNANVTYIKQIEESASGFHISKTHLYQAKDAQINCHSFAMDGGLVRSDLCSDLTAEGAHVTMNGLYLTAQKQHVAHYTRVNHLSAHATSEEYYKGILGGSSQAVFNGAIYVEKDAQKTNAAQQNKNLLLSKKSEINTKPQLEIFADDVKCAHGATVGQLEDKALFYLQSRGIAKEDAITLLVDAFAGDLIDKLNDTKHAALKHHLRQRLQLKLREAYEQ